MIALPSLAGAPRAVSQAKSDPLAAKCALRLAAPGPIASVRADKAPLEHLALVRELTAWLVNAARSLEIFQPALRVQLGVASPCGCAANAAEPIIVWIANQSWDPVGERWYLERRYRLIEREAPGLGRTALEVLDRADFGAVPVYMPRTALGFAQYTYWLGEADETYVLANWEDVEEDEKRSADEIAEEHGVVRRAWFDKALPPEVSTPRRVLKEADLERIARRPGDAGALARKVLLLQHASKGKPRFTLHRGEPDFAEAVGYGAALRWNAKDPMFRAFDDYTNYIYEGGNSDVSEAWGWFVLKGPQELRALLDHLEERFARARIIEEIIMLLATWARE